MTVADYAKLYGKSERTIKRYRAQGLPLDDEQSMRQIMGLKQSRLGTSKFARKAPVLSAQSRLDEGLAEELDDRETCIRDLVRAYCHLYYLNEDDASLRGKLKPAIELILPYIAVEAD